jgi:hypothetical protein
MHRRWLSRRRDHLNFHQPGVHQCLDDDRRGGHEPATKGGDPGFGVSFGV